jgi:hypothetical protein
MNNLLFQRHPDAVDRSEKARTGGWLVSANSFSMQRFFLVSHSVLTAVTKIKGSRLACVAFKTGKIGIEKAQAGFSGASSRQKLPIGAGRRSCAHFASRFNMADAFASAVVFFGSVFLVRPAL